MHDQTGHRQRVIARFRSEGLDSFEPVHALELILFCTIAQKDTKQIARDLLNRFGSFQGVLEAPAEELTKVEGIGPKSALLIELLNATSRYYQVRMKDNPVIMNSISDCAKLFSKHFLGQRVETVFFIALDAKKRLISCQKIAEGDVNCSQIPTRKLVDTLLGLNASAVILAHNHPSGLAIPSMDDIMVTRNLSVVLDALGIVLVDHLVFSENDWVSLVASGSYRPTNRQVKL